ncbi:hypothetical protein PR048_033269 [Dryococelus australis]|uniref:Uncharacterized protein n=1 Tax=Dryococelus australis TaxID=614101 RepID=A0ABQ9FZU5_9NEOP|nr:hypothetical protein PR048_033269 [Dryococelus australis]
MRVIEVNMEKRRNEGGGGKREIPEKTRRPTASSGTISNFENPVAQPGIEPGSPWWEASVLTAQLPWPPVAKRWEIPYMDGKIALRHEYLFSIVSTAKWKDKRKKQYLNTLMSTSWQVEGDAPHRIVAVLHVAHEPHQNVEEHDHGHAFVQHARVADEVSRRLHVVFQGDYLQQHTAEIKEKKMSLVGQLGRGKYTHILATPKDYIQNAPCWPAWPGGVEYTRHANGLYPGCPMLTSWDGGSKLTTPMDYVQIDPYWPAGTAEEYSPRRRIIYSVPCWPAGTGEYTNHADGLYTECPILASWAGGVYSSPQRIIYRVPHVGQLGRGEYTNHADGLYTECPMLASWSGGLYSSPQRIIYRVPHIGQLGRGEYTHHTNGLYTEYPMLASGVGGVLSPRRRIVYRVPHIGQLGRGEYTHRTDGLYTECPMLASWDGGSILATPTDYIQIAPHWPAGAAGLGRGGGGLYTHHADGLEREERGADEERELHGLPEHASLGGRGNVVDQVVERDGEPHERDEVGDRREGRQQLEVAHVVEQYERQKQDHHVEPHIDRPPVKVHHLAHSCRDYNTCIRYRLFAIKASDNLEVTVIGVYYHSVKDKADFPTPKRDVLLGLEMDWFWMTTFTRGSYRPRNLQGPRINGKWPDSPRVLGESSERTGPLLQSQFHRPRVRQNWNTHHLAQDKLLPQLQNKKENTMHIILTTLGNGEQVSQGSRIGGINGKESAMAFAKDPFRHSPGAISENHGKPKPGRESNPGPHCATSLGECVIVARNNPLIPPPPLPDSRGLLYREVPHVEAVDAEAADEDRPDGAQGQAGVHEGVRHGKDPCPEAALEQVHQRLKVTADTNKHSR